LNEFKIDSKVKKSISNVGSKIIEWRDEIKAKKLSKPWVNGESENPVPDKELGYGNFGNVAIFPGDARVEKVSQDSSKESRDKTREPQEVVVLNNIVSDDTVE